MEWPRRKLMVDEKFVHLVIDHKLLLVLSLLLLLLLLERVLLAHLKQVLVIQQV